MKRLFILCILSLLLIPGVKWAQQPQAQTQPLYDVNAKYVQGVGPGYWPTPGSGLNLNIASGTSFCSETPSYYAGGIVALTASATNYVYLAPASSCNPQVNTSGFASGDIPIAIVVTGASSVTTVTDVRTWFVSQTSGGSGTVTSVALSLPGEFSVTGSPVTSSGVLTAAWAPQAQKLVLASPVSASGTPSFRALTLADLPAIGFANLTGTISAAQLPSDLVLTDASATQTITLASGTELDIKSSSGSEIAYFGYGGTTVTHIAKVISESTVVVDNNGGAASLVLSSDRDTISDGFGTENTDVRGVISVSAATSASVTFPQAYSHAPACLIAPSSNPGGLDWWVTTSTTAVTANLSASGTVSFFYICIGANN